MRKRFRTLAIVLMAAMCSLSLLAAVACGEEEQQQQQGGTTTYTLTYAAGASDATGEAPAAEKYAEGATVTLKGGDVFTRTGYTFDKWSDGTATYAAGASFTMPAKDVTLTATWTQDEEALPDGTEKVDSVPQGLLTTENGTAKAVWLAEYADDGVKVTAWVTDGTIYDKSSNLYANDGVEVIVAKTERATGYTEHTISVLADANGKSIVKNLGTDTEAEGAVIEAKYFSLDGKAVAGYCITVTVPYTLTGVTKAEEDAVLSLSFTNASNAANANVVTDTTYGTEREHVNTYMVFKGGAFSANPLLEMGFWGKGGTLEASTSWDLSHDDGTADAYIEMTETIGDNYIYIKNSGATTVYAEMEIQASEMYKADNYPKFGLTLSNATATRRLLYFVDCVTSDGWQFKPDSVNLDYVYRSETDWLWPETVKGKIEGTSDAYVNGFVKLGMYRQGGYLLLTYNGEALGDPLLLDGFNATETTYIGLASFNVHLKVKNYSVTTEASEMTKYKDIVDAYVPKISTKTLDGKLDDWTEEQKSNPFILPSDQGRSVSVYGFMDTMGVTLFFDAYHREHKSTENDWWNNTNIEFRLGGDATKQYAAAANGNRINIAQSNCAFVTTVDDEGLYHTTAEVFVPYEEINGYTAQSAYVPANVYFKIGGVFGNVWETGDWWRAGGNNEQGIFITQNGILGGTHKTIDGELTDWDGAKWTERGRYTWTALLEEDGLYVAVKAHQGTIAGDREYVSGADGGDGSQWWLNQNLEIQYKDGGGLKAARIIYFGGKAYHTVFVNDAAAKLTQSADSDDELVFEFFIARQNLTDAQAKEIKAWIGGQLFETKEDHENRWAMALDGDVIRETGYKPAEPTITWNKGEGVGADPTTAVVWDEDAWEYSITLPANPYESDDYDFLQWSVSINGQVTLHDANDKVILPAGATVVITATWAPKNVEMLTVTFETGYDGGNAPSPLQIAKNGKASQIPTIARGGYKFLGWFVKNPDDGQPGEREFNADFTVVESITVVAKWEDLIDGDLKDWTEEQKTNPNVILATNGRSVTTYATMRDDGVYVFYDVIHNTYKTDGEWHQATNAEFRLGNDGGDTQRYLSANGQTQRITRGVMTSQEESGKQHTRAEIFIAYDLIDGYDANSPYIPSCFMWKTTGEVDFFWEGGKDFWYLAESSPGMNNTIITRKGIAAGSQKKIDGDLSDWDALTPNHHTGIKAGVTVEYGALYADDGLYIALKVKAKTINVNGTDWGGAWYKDTNLEFMPVEPGDKNPHSRIVIYEGKICHSGFISAAQYKYIPSAEGDDELDFEVFIAKPLLNLAVSAVRSVSDTSVTIRMGGQLYGEGMAETWQEYLWDITVEKQA